MGKPLAIGWRTVPGSAGCSVLAKAAASRLHLRDVASRARTWRVAECSRQAAGRQQVRQPAATRKTSTLAKRRAPQQSRELTPYLKPRSISAHAAAAATTSRWRSAASPSAESRRRPAEPGDSRAPDRRRDFDRAFSRVRHAGPARLFHGPGRFVRRHRFRHPPGPVLPAPRALDRSLRKGADLDAGRGFRLGCDWRDLDRVCHQHALRVRRARSAGRAGQRGHGHSFRAARRRVQQGARARHFLFLETRRVRQRPRWHHLRRDGRPRLRHDRKYSLLRPGDRERRV